MGTTMVVITTKFAALHNWSDCPFEEVSYLKDTHRHVFHVKMKWKVSHDNRNIEFFMMKSKVQRFINENWANKDLGSKSCEMLSKNLAYHFNADFVSVYEDGENGAEYQN